MLYKSYFQKESPSPDELAHHGVLGMKWGVRRFQNADGSLTPAGKKRISKQYERLSKKAATEIASKNTKIYVDSYNKTADEYNNGKIDKFNKQYIKKGKTFDDPNYEKEYMNAFEKDRMKHFMKMYVSELEKDENYRKAESLVKQYDMTKFDDLARENAKGRKEIEKIIKGNTDKMEDVRNQKLQKRAAELASKYGDKAKVEVKGNKIVVTGADGRDTWTVT